MSNEEFKAKIAALMRGDEREDSILYVARNRAHKCVVRTSSDALTPSEVMFAERRKNQKTEKNQLAKKPATKINVRSTSN